MSLCPVHRRLPASLVLLRTSPYLCTGALAIVLGMVTVPFTSAQQLAGAAAAYDLGHLEWRELGPGGVGGRIVDFAVVGSDPDTLFVATAQSGVWNSVDGGLIWQPVFERQSLASIGGIAVARSNPNLIWVGTGESNGRNLVSTSWGDGVYKSEDDGKSWKHMGLEGTQQIGRLRIHPEDPDIVFVPVLGSLWHDDAEQNALRGVYRTRDGGASWEKVLAVGAHGGLHRHRHGPSRPRHDVRRLLAA